MRVRREKHRIERTARTAPGRLAAVILSVAIHLTLLLALILARPRPPRAPTPVVLAVELVEGPRFQTQTTAAQARRSPANMPAPPHAPPAPAARSEITASAEPNTSDAGAASEPSPQQLAGAAVAGAGSPTGGCDMARRVQSALRKDPLVQAAVAGAGGGAIMVWNGDWVRRQGEDGKGLAAVREAVMWAIAFAPEGCRAEPVHGLILFTVDDRAEASQLAIGARQWRWSDLLTPSPSLSGEEVSGR